MLLSVLAACALFGVHSAQAVALWGQCGGINYSGTTTCDSGACVVVSDYYHQCQPGSTAPTNPAPSPPSPSGPATPTSPTVKAPPTGYNQLSNFGSNPNNVGIYSYVPSGLTANPGIVVALHYCSGSAQNYYTGTQWKNLADQKKNFIVLYGDSPRSGKCWDVSSAASLKHDGGSDSLGIVNAVRYGISNWGANTSKIFVTGSSSGAMMAELLAGAYPDVFKAAVAVAGVPYGCFATTDGSQWNSQCANGQLSKTGAAWGDQARGGYSGYSGARPKIMLIHGTSDTTLNYNNFKEAIKQWANVLGVSETPTKTTQNDSESGTTHTTYGSGVLEAYSMQGATHDIAYAAVHETQQIAFFGL